MMDRPAEIQSFKYSSIQMDKYGPQRWIVNRSQINSEDREGSGQEIVSKERINSGNNKGIHQRPDVEAYEFI